jgi:hypothetical protein
MASPKRSATEAGAQALPASRAVPSVVSALTSAVGPASSAFVSHAAAPAAPASPTTFEAAPSPFSPPPNAPPYVAVALELKRLLEHRAAIRKALHKKYANLMRYANPMRQGGGEATDLGRRQAEPSRRRVHWDSLMEEVRSSIFFSQPRAASSFCTDAAPQRPSASLPTLRPFPSARGWARMFFKSGGGSAASLQRWRRRPPPSSLQWGLRGGRTPSARLLLA